MKIETLKTIDVRNKAYDLGLDVGDSISLIPPDFERVDSTDKLERAAGTTTIKKILSQNDIPVRLVAEDEDLRTKAELDIEVSLPIIFLSLKIIMEDWDTIVNMFNLLSSHFSGKADEIELTSIVEKKIEENYEYDELRFRGSPEKLSKLPDYIQKRLKKHAR